MLEVARASPKPLPHPRADALLRVEDLEVEFATALGPLRAVEGLSFSVARGETVAIVGESGSGKSVTALSIMRLLAHTARVKRGRVLFESRDLLGLDGEAMRAIRGRDIAMIFQEPMTSLNPVLSVGLQIAESLQIHLRLKPEAARARAVELLRLVGISDAERRLGQFPHQFSGGMRQRVMIAIALACNPKLIIADEPTTALDVTIQAQILELMKNLSRQFEIALIVITHNLGIVARYADRVVVLYAAKQVEQGPAEALFRRPLHPYTMGLLRSVPRLDKPRRGKLETIEGMPPNLAEPPAGCRFAPRCPHRVDTCVNEPPLESLEGGRTAACWRSGEIASGQLGWAAGNHAVFASPDAQYEPLLAVRGLTKHFAVRMGLGGGKGLVRAVEDVSFDIAAGETLGLVGESGCGKTTVGRLILRLEEPTAGSVRFAGQDLLGATPAQLKLLRRKIQVIFQDPYSSLNPRMTVGQIVGEPLHVFRLAARGSALRERVGTLLQQVGLRSEIAARYPHQLSGGQRQRVGIARALALEPSFIVCDEAVSALDVSIQAQIINLLEDLQRRLKLAYLFIAHDLAVVRHIAMRVVVMYLGRVMEVAERDTLYREPLHPYTKLLLDAAPVPDPAAEKARAPRLISGELPSPLAPPAGCVFHTRCPMAGLECRQAVPPLREIRPGHFAACIKV